MRIPSRMMPRKTGRSARPMSGSTTFMMGTEIIPRKKIISHDVRSPYNIVVSPLYFACHSIPAGHCQLRRGGDSTEELINSPTQEGHPWQHPSLTPQADRPATLVAVALVG